MFAQRADVVDGQTRVEIANEPLDFRRKQRFGARARAHVNLAAARRAIAVRQIDHRRRRLAERFAERVSDDAGDHEVRVARPHMTPERRAVGREAPDELLVDDRLLRRRGVGQIRKVGPCVERNAHRLEIAGRDRVAQRHVGPAVGTRVPFDRERAHRQPVDVERHGARDGGGLDAGQRAEPLEETAREVAGGRPIHVACAHVVRGEQHAFAPEARIGFARLGEAAEKHRRCQQNEQRQADLAGHQQVAHPAPSRGADARSNRGLRIDAREL